MSVRISVDRLCCELLSATYGRGKGLYFLIHFVGQRPSADPFVRRNLGHFESKGPFSGRYDRGEALGDPEWVRAFLGDCDPN